MVCAGLETLTDNSIVGILSFPTSCFYPFYELIMGAFFIVIALILKASDEDKFIKSDMISAMGVSAVATIFISLLGTVLGIIQSDIFVEIFVVGMIFIVIWLLKK